MKRQFSIILPTDYGQMIVNRFDTFQTDYLFKTEQAIDHNEICMMAEILWRRCGTDRVPRATFIDVGGCFGTWSLALAPVCKQIHVFEPQRILYNMICGSVALNSLEHIYCHNVAIGKHERLSIPKFDYGKELSFGSIEFGESQKEKLDQERGEGQEFIQSRALDDYQFEHVDGIKIDVEGMEVEALHSATWTVSHHRPVLYIETLKCDAQKVVELFDTFNYSFWDTGMNYLCVPNEFVENIGDIISQLKLVHAKVSA